MLEALKQSVWQANLELQRAGLVILTWGNVSGLDRDSGLVAIKPSGVSYAKLRPEQLAIVALDGTVVEGDLRPSSDTPTHLELYRSFPGVGGIAHTHSPAATAWAQAKRPLPCYGTTHADSFYGSVPLTADLTAEALAGDYELETGKAIVAACTEFEPLSMPAVLVASHGPFTWGATPDQAVENSIVLEQVALMGLMTNALDCECGGIGRGLLDKHFLRKHGTGAYYGQK